MHSVIGERHTPFLFAFLFQSKLFHIIPGVSLAGGVDLSRLMVQPNLCFRITWSPESPSPSLSQRSPAGSVIALSWSKQPMEIDSL